MSGIVTPERLREALDYNRETGLFTRKRSGARWKAGQVAGNIRPNNGYVSIKIDKRLYLAHRLAWLYVYGVWPNGDLDHKDTIRTHNWISNLRPATRTQNNANTPRRRDNTSGLKGVTYISRDHIWRAQISIGGKQTYLGSFKTAEAAHAAYCKAAAEIFGKFARTA